MNGRARLALPILHPVTRAPCKGDIIRKRRTSKAYEHGENPLCYGLGLSTVTQYDGLLECMISGQINTYHEALSSG